MKGKKKPAWPIAKTHFETAVRLLQESLQRVANNGKASTKYIALQNKIINSLIQYQQSTQWVVERLQKDNTRLMLGLNNKQQELADTKEMFEAICIIHGIMDIGAWMAKGKYYLTSEAVWLNSQSIILLPDLLKQKIDNLPTDEKTAINKVLFREYDDNIKRLEKQLEILKTKDA